MHIPARPLAAIACVAALSPVALAQSLTPVEAASGWKILFDGNTTSNFRGYRKPGFPEKGWAVENGALHVVKGGGGGDIVTNDQYGDFELTLEYKCAPGANSGIMYRVAEQHDTAWMTGPEFQVLDDGGTKESANSTHSAGALYDIIATPDTKTVKPAGEWNSARIRLSNGVLQHWLNGAKVVECRVDGQEWKDKIAASKFKDYAGFGLQPKGHIALQEHGDDVWYRNIRIRDLSAPLPGEVKLFNGTDMKGWTFFLNDGGAMDGTWSVKDGVIICSGKPAGYIRTEKDYTNYVLRLEWRFSPVTKQAGNSGVLLRLTGEDKVWPRSIEGQLMSGSAGDFWNIGDVPMKPDPARTSGRNTKRTHTAENPVGEWNDYEIIVNGGDVTLIVNGETLNHASGCEVIPGKIALQSEGAEIHFRNVRLSPLK